MPVYEFSCDKCGEPFERLLRSARDRAHPVCPACGARQVSRQPSVFAAHTPAPPTRALPAGGCGRCGDPNGPCGIE